MIIRNNTAAWDLAKRAGDEKENEFARLLGDTTLEVKYDRFANNNLFIEMYRDTHSGGVILSGIYTTQSDKHVLCKSNISLTVDTKDLQGIVMERWLAFSALNPAKTIWEWMIKGGDGKRTWGILVSLEEIIAYTHRLRLN